MVKKWLASLAVVGAMLGCASNYPNIKEENKAVPTNEVVMRYSTLPEEYRIRQGSFSDDAENRKITNEVLEGFYKGIETQANYFYWCAKGYIDIYNDIMRELDKRSLLYPQDIERVWGNIEIIEERIMYYYDSLLRLEELIEIFDFPYKEKILEGITMKLNELEAYLDSLISKDENKKSESNGK